MRFPFLLGFFGVLASVASSAHAQKSETLGQAPWKMCLPPNPSKAVYTGRYIVQFTRPVDAMAMLAVRAATNAKAAVPAPSRRLVVLSTASVKQLTEAQRGALGLEFIEPEMRMQLVNPTYREPFRAQVLPPEGKAPIRRQTTPNDPYLQYQWALLAGPNALDVGRIRDLSRGSGVIVAVVDTGVTQTLTDLRGVTFVTGRNVVAGNANTTDDNGHGSHVAGTIAQATDNGLGVAGLAPESLIMPVKVLNRSGSGTNFTIAAGIRWAVDHGARVINLSVGGGDSRTLREAVEYALSKNVLLCAAAGNSGKRGLLYPARYPGVLAVGATDVNGAKAPFSQYGPEVSEVAPGVHILQQTVSGGRQGYFYFSGTSMATPHVTGACALMLARRPSLTAAEVQSILASTSRDLGAPGRDEFFGWGLIDILSALNKVDGAPVPTPPVPPVIEPLPPTEPPVVAPSEPIAEQIFARINAERTKEGLKPVLVHPLLTKAAGLFAAEMNRRGVMTHTGEDGSTPGDRITRAGYSWQTYGEIVAFGQPTPEAVVLAWMNSPGHRAIIMGTQYEEIGVGYSGRYYCCDFGTRRPGTEKAAGAARRRRR